MNRELRIGNHEVGDTHPPYFLAEIGHNHGGNLETAMAMIEAAADAGASGVKFQKRQNASLFTKAFAAEPAVNVNAFGPTYGEHRAALEFGAGEYIMLQQKARRCGVDFIVTAFDEPSVDFLAALEVDAIKIASADVSNHPLLRHAASTGIPIIMSTGGHSLKDTREAVRVLTEAGAQFALLHCTATYPAVVHELDLETIAMLREWFPTRVIGWSAHDCPPSSVATSVLAYGLGARIFERHFTLDHAAKGSDHHFSVEPQELAAITAALNEAYEAQGVARTEPLPKEVASIAKMAKSCYAARDLPAGHVLTPEDIAIKSPRIAGAMTPAELEHAVGSVLRVDKRADDALFERARFDSEDGIQ